MTSRLPRGWRRWLFRLPIYLYRWQLGWLMPKRFLCLTHIGRKSNQPRYVVIEVTEYAQTYPKMAQNLMAFLSYETDGSEADYRRIGESNVRFVALQVQR